MKNKELIELINNYKLKYLYRREDGCIDKFEFIDENTVIDIQTGMVVRLNETVLLGKKAETIIDLVEVGDYVNGYKVSFIAQDCAKFVQCDYPVETGATNHYKFYKESIRDIVTKEQFNQMKYIVGDE